jgi:hypothetical protein
MSLLCQLADPLRQAADQRVQRWTRLESQGWLLTAGLELTSCRPAVVMEKALLRQQLIVLERGSGLAFASYARQIRCPQPNWRDRSPIVLLASRPLRAGLRRPHAGPVERGTDHCAA